MTHFKEQGLISGACGVQGLRPVERALIVERSACKLEPARPVHRPITCQVVGTAFQTSDSQVAGGNLHLLHPDAPRSSGNHYNGVIF